MRRFIPRKMSYMCSTDVDLQTVYIIRVFQIFDHVQHSFHPLKTFYGSRAFTMQLRSHGRVAIVQCKQRLNMENVIFPKAYTRYSNPQYTYRLNKAWNNISFLEIRFAFWFSGWNFTYATENARSTWQFCQCFRSTLVRDWKKTRKEKTITWLLNGNHVSCSKNCSTLSF